MSDLVNRRAAQTRAEIVGAAMAVFAEQGFDATSMNDVASAAGVSRRTIYRYFETKDDLVFESPRRWLEVLNRVLDTRTAVESTRDLYHRALLAVARFIQDDAVSVLAGFAVLTSSPSLLARHGRSDAEWTTRYLELIGPDVADEPHGALLAATAAMSLVAAQNALIAIWAAGQPESDLIEMINVMLDQIDSVWPPGSR
jgi:AcrR family transcriptional regulator